MTRFFLLSAIFSFPILSLCQEPGVVPDWRALSIASSEVLVISVKNDSRLIDPEKLKRTSISQQSDVNSLQEIPLQKPSEYTLGRIYTAEVLSVLKTKNRIRAGQIIQVYIPGSSYAEGMPVIFVNDKYVVFLEPIGKKEKEVTARGVTRSLPEDNSDRVNKFDPTFAFTIVGNSLGANSLKGREDLLVKIKTLLGKH